MSQVSVDDKLVGVTLDERYRLDDVLGEGGMGRVYRGTQLAVSREVAVKVLHKNLARDDTIANRFLREAEVVSGFSHPNIVNLVDFGTDSEHGVVYLVMELLEGRELSDLLRGRRCRPALAVELADQVCAALTEPHNEGVIHRDLKPDNLMVQTVSDGSVQTKILDFGIAHVVQAQTRLTETDATCGTPSYMSPEQVRTNEVYPATDLYALGVILFELLTGQPPIRGETSFEVMFGHIDRMPPSVTDLADDVPDQLAGLIGEMLEKDPDDRPDDANTVRERLEEIRIAEEYRRIRVEPDLDVEEAVDAWFESTDVALDETLAPEQRDAESLADVRQRVESKVAPDPTGETASVEDPREVVEESASSDAPPADGGSGTRERWTSDADAASTADEPVEPAGAASNSRLLAIAGGLVVLVGVASGLIWGIGGATDGSSTAEAAGPGASGTESSNATEATGGGGATEAAATASSGADDEGTEGDDSTAATTGDSAASPESEPSGREESSAAAEDEAAGSPASEPSGREESSAAAEDDAAASAESGTSGEDEPTDAPPRGATEQAEAVAETNGAGVDEDAERTADRDSAEQQNADRSGSGSAEANDGNDPSNRAAPSEKHDSMSDGNDEDGVQVLPVEP